jgi:hypothetical protein
VAWSHQPFFDPHGGEHSELLLLERIHRITGVISLMKEGSVYGGQNMASCRKNRAKEGQRECPVFTSSSKA